MKKSYPFVCPPQQQGEKRKVPETVEAASPKNLELCPLPMPPSSWKVTSLASESSNMINIWYHQRILLFIIGREWGVGSIGDSFKSSGSENLFKLWIICLSPESSEVPDSSLSISSIHMYSGVSTHLRVQLPAASWKFSQCSFVFLSKEENLHHVVTILWQHSPFDSKEQPSCRRTQH